jgi:serine/threonine protein kinase
VIDELNVEGARNERDVLESVQHPFIVRLHCAFHDHGRLYLLMDWHNGGQLLARAPPPRPLDPPPRPRGRPRARDVRGGGSAGGPLAVLGGRGAVLPRGAGARYRAPPCARHCPPRPQGDPPRAPRPAPPRRAAHGGAGGGQPENVLLNSAGHVVVTDFGASKIAHDREGGGDIRTDSWVGTEMYMAPEQLRGEQYGRVVDWWAVGVLAWEMVTGSNPFYHSNPAQVASKVEKKKLMLPSHFSAGTHALLKGLLTRDPAKRLGKQGAHQARPAPHRLRAIHHQQQQQQQQQ